MMIEFLVNYLKFLTDVSGFILFSPPSRVGVFFRFIIIDESGCRKNRGTVNIKSINKIGCSVLR